MKTLTVLILSLLFYSCCGVNRVTDSTTVSNSKDIALADKPKTSTVDIAQESETTVEEETDKASELIEETPAETIKEPAPIPVVTIPIDVFDHNSWDALLQKYVTDEGQVNYKGFRADKRNFVSYLNLLSDNPPQESWSKDETLAYWMNVYNAFTVKLIIDNYPTKSIKDIDGPWSKRFIRIGKKWYTLNDVEHRIIRKMDEPRIHFALVCAAVSCPKLYNKAFKSSSLENDLSQLTSSFLNDASKNNLSENSIKLSKIFKWYGGDFKKNGSTLIDFLNQYSNVTINSRAKKTFKDYNWNLNE